MRLIKRVVPNPAFERTRLNASVVRHETPRVLP